MSRGEAREGRRRDVGGVSQLAASEVKPVHRQGMGLLLFAACWSIIFIALFF